jgi:hypothetical protein
MERGMRSSKGLLIGAAKYGAASGLSSLKTPESDAAALGALLADPDSGFLVQCPTSATSIEIRKVSENFFTKSSKDDVLLFYFSGHGKLGQNGGLYLCPTDTEVDLIDATAISLSWLNQVIDRCTAAQVIIILDCCYSGEAHVAFKADIPSLIQSNIGGGRGKYLITSSADYQVSLERPGDRNSLFTKWLIQGIQSRDADLNKDGVITVEELFEYTAAKVRGEYPQQSPQFWKWGTSPGDAIIRGDSRRALLANAPTEDPFFNAAREMFARRAEIVPFLGPGVFGRGPLSTYQIAAAMAAQAGLKSSNAASTSELAQHLKNIYDREQFLHFYRTLIRDQTSHAETCSSYALIEQSLSPEQPTLIVSLTHDCGLEDALRARAKKFSILSHVLAADDEAQIGQLLVIDVDGAISYRMCLSDEWLPDANSCEAIIYKILGSPFLSDYIGRRDVDTVVVTEEDYGCLFGFFENEHRKSPSAITRWLQRRPSVFLGFGLDVWEYRLLTFLLEQTVRQSPSRRGRRYAVREPTTPVETLSWTRLGMDLIRMDAEEFSKRLLSKRANGVE